MLAFCSLLTLGFKLIAPHLQSTPVFLPGKFHGQSCLEGATVHGVSKSQIWLSMHWLAGSPHRGSWYGNHLDCRGTAGCLKHQAFPIILGLQQLRSFYTCHCFEVTQKLAMWPWASTLPSLVSLFEYRLPPHPPANLDLWSVKNWIDPLTGIRAGFICCCCIGRAVNSNPCFKARGLNVLFSCSSQSPRGATARNETIKRKQS